MSPGALALALCLAGAQDPSTCLEAARGAEEAETAVAAEPELGGVPLSRLRELARAAAESGGLEVDPEPPASRPPRVGAAGWCGAEACDAGVAAQLHGWPCRVVSRGGWCGLDLLAGQATAGAGVRAELTGDPVPASSLPFLPAASGQSMRLYLGAAVVAPYAGLDDAEWSAALYLRATLEGRAQPPPEE